MTKNITIYPIIVTYNGLKWIDKCLGSLRTSTLPLHTIVIDNASTDGTPDYIATHYSEVELIRSPQNLGFGKGNNIGLQKALDDGADYVFLLNQDAWIMPDTIEKLVEVHQKNQEYGILSPVHLNGENSGLETKFAEYAAPDNTPDLLSNLFLGNLKLVYTTKFVNAAAWLISKDCLIKTGGFNSLFPHYGEDEDYINRVHYWNFKTGIVPKAIVTHDSIFNWEKIEHHPVRNVIFNLIPLSNINHRYRSVWLLFIKKSIDDLTSLLLFRQFKRFKTRFTAFFKTVILFGKIKKSRHESMKHSAFLK